MRVIQAINDNTPDMSWDERLSAAYRALQNHNQIKFKTEQARLENINGIAAQLTQLGIENETNTMIRNQALMEILRMFLQLTGVLDGE